MLPLDRLLTATTGLFEYLYNYLPEALRDGAQSCDVVEIELGLASVDQNCIMCS